MSENVYERIHRVLSWKRIVAFNVVLFLILVVPISVRLAQQDTENRSGAAGEVNPVPSVIPPPSYPASPPKIDRVSEFFGKTGDTIVILGNNFGEYQWASKVYVGNVEASEDSVIRWTNTILEVQIPESARTGRVWVTVNGQQASWEGSLLLTDVARSAQVGMVRNNANTATVWLGNAGGATRGLVEIGHVGEPVNADILADGSITNTSASSDALGRKLKIEFNLNQPLSSSQSNMLSVNHPGVGTLEIVRVELYDSNGSLIPVFADPLNIKVF